MTAKTLGEIIDAVRDGERPDYEDLRYAVCAMDALMTFDRMALSSLHQAEAEGQRRILTRSAIWQSEENYNRVKRALEKPPKEYVGWSNDPDNPEFLERRRKSIRAMKSLLEGQGKT